MNEQPLRTVRLGLLGFGTVGQSFVKILQEESPRLHANLGLDLSIVAIGNRNVARKRASWVRGDVRYTDDLDSVVADPSVDLVVELMGGIEPARSLLSAAFRGGKGVVTANKALLARHGSELAALARENGCGLGLEASVAGGIPILRALRESFAGDRLESVAGILNGTCNFILTEMERTRGPYAAILAEAQRLGYAEADPRADVEGDDAACKLTLLSRMAFGQDVPLEAVPREGITRLLPCDFVYAETLGRTPRLLGTAALLPGGRLAAGVRVHMVSRESILAKVVGPFNAVLVKGAFGGEFAFYGRGAGGDPTATAVLADVVELARSGYRALVPPLAHARLAPHAPASAADFRAPFYVRFVVRDRPGIIAGISRCLADHEINIDAVFQAPYEDKEALPFVVTLEEVAEDRLLTALGEIEALPFHVEPPLALPMTGSAG